MDTPLLSAYLWGYKNYQAGAKSIETFNKFYPNSDMFVRIDTDGDFDNYKEALSKYNVDIKFQEYKLGYPGKFSPSGHDAGRDHWPFKNLYTWLKSIYDCCKQTQSKYMIILEEDVFLLREISIIQTEFDVAIVRNRNGFPDILIKFIQQFKGNDKNLGYGACGGAIINTQTFIKGFDLAIKKLESQFDILAKKTKLVGWSDIMLQVVIMCAGGVVVINDELIEPWMQTKGWIDDSWKNYEVVNYLKDISELP